MKEIEMKILELPKNIFLAKMKMAGGRLVAKIAMKVVYFDFPDRRIKKAKNLLRVRECSAKGKKETEVVFKIFQGVKNGCKIFEEIEFVLTGKKGFAEAVKFLSELGFVQTLSYSKNRTQYACAGQKLEYDEYPGMPPLLEIEGKNAKIIHALARRLGLQDYETSAESITELAVRKYPRSALAKAIKSS